MDLRQSDVEAFIKAEMALSLAARGQEVDIIIVTTVDSGANQRRS